MKLFNLFLVILSLVFTGTSLVHAQNSVGASGGRATGTGGNVSYSIGQLNTLSIKNNNGTVAQGVQQPYEIYVIKGEAETGIQLTISANPNPAIDFFVLKIEDGWFDNLSYRIYDGLGRLIEQEKIVNKETRISVTKLYNAYYFVKVYKSIFEVKSFKIVKVN